MCVSVLSLSLHFVVWLQLFFSISQRDEANQISLNLNPAAEREKKIAVKKEMNAYLPYHQHADNLIFS